MTMTRRAPRPAGLRNALGHRLPILTYECHVAAC